MLQNGNFVAKWLFFSKIDTYGHTISLLECKTEIFFIAKSRHARNFLDAIISGGKEFLRVGKTHVQKALQGCCSKMGTPYSAEIRLGNMAEFRKGGNRQGTFGKMLFEIRIRFRNNNRNILLRSGDFGEALQDAIKQFHRAKVSLSLPRV